LNLSDSFLFTEVAVLIRVLIINYTTIILQMQFPVNR